jgi:hypothetical protein
MFVPLDGSSGEHAGRWRTQGVGLPGGHFVPGQTDTLVGGCPAAADASPEPTRAAEERVRAWLGRAPEPLLKRVPHEAGCNERR